MILLLRFNQAWQSFQKTLIYVEISRFSTSLQFYTDAKTARRVAALCDTDRHLGRFKSRPSSAHTSVPEAGIACTWLKSNKGIGGPRDSPEENGARQSCRDQEPRWFTLRISNETLAAST